VTRSPEPANCPNTEYFENLYRLSQDPWRFRSSTYEQAKYNTTLTALSREHYASAFEPGCSIGEMTARLALRCARLIATDISPTAVIRARERCAAFPHVKIECQDLRAEQPGGPFDLIVLSEVAYYFNVDSVAALTKQLSERLASGGELVAVHWRGHSKDHVLHADEVHRVLKQTLGFEPAHQERHPGFQLDSWIKP
jgi:cyclopropane fatty-acyl-phospholipid synthase-like methyltransferase